MKIAVDTESTGLFVWQGDRPFAVSMFWENGEWGYWEWPVDPLTRRVMYESHPDYLKEIKEIVQDKNNTLKFYNYKFDYRMLLAAGIECTAPFDEVSFKIKSIASNQLSFGLKPICKKFLKISDEDQKDLKSEVIKSRRIGKKLGWKLGENIAEDYWLPQAVRRLAPELARKKSIKGSYCKDYALLDAERTLLLDEMATEAMNEYEASDSRLRLWNNYNDELKLLRVVLDMEERGALVCKKALQEAKQESIKVRDTSHNYLKKVFKDPEYNFNSSKQNAKYFYTKAGLNLEPQKRSKKTGEPSCDATSLEDYSEHPVIIEYNRAKANDKAISTFYSNYERLSEDIGTHYILHPLFNQWGCRTSRFSCQFPNLQQVSNPETTSSKLAKYVVNIRKIFTPRKDYIWWRPDYSQIEVIIFADVTNEESLLTAIRNGEDIHTASTNRIWGGVNNSKFIKAILSIEKNKSVQFAQRLGNRFNWDIVKAEESLGAKNSRKKAKGVTFTKIYGGGVQALINWIPGIDEREAREILNDYDEAFPTIKDKQNELILEAKNNGYIVNPYGLKLDIDIWKVHTTAMNYKVQSAAAKLMKLGMLKVASYFKELGIDAQILLTIHDELIIEIRKKHAFKSVRDKVCELMSNNEGIFSVPTPVKLEISKKNWAENITP